MKLRNDIIEPVLYKTLFTSDIGEKVLLELTALYYDRLSYTQGDQFETAFKEGQRSVIEYILQKTIIGENND